MLSWSQPLGNIRATKRSCDFLFKMLHTYMQIREKRPEKYVIAALYSAQPQHLYSSNIGVMTASKMLMVIVQVREIVLIVSLTEHAQLTLDWKSIHTVSKKA